MKGELAVILVGPEIDGERQSTESFARKTTAERRRWWSFGSSQTVVEVSGGCAHRRTEIAAAMVRSKE
jgi:hypothetical protein